MVKGNELVTKLVSSGIAADRDEATRVGRYAWMRPFNTSAAHACDAYSALVAQRALFHVTEEHHFHDHPYFYKVDEAILESVCGLLASV